MAVRTARQTLGTKIKCVEKIVQAIERATQEKDLPKISEEYEKYNKVLIKENAQK